MLCVVTGGQWKRFNIVSHEALYVWPLHVKWLHSHIVEAIVTETPLIPRFLLSYKRDGGRANEFLGHYTTVKSG